MRSHGGSTERRVGGCMADGGWRMHVYLRVTVRVLHVAALMYTCVEILNARVYMRAQQHETRVQCLGSTRAAT